MEPAIQVMGVYGPDPVISLTVNGAKGDVDLRPLVTGLFSQRDGLFGPPSCFKREVRKGKRSTYNFRRAEFYQAFGRYDWEELSIFLSRYMGEGEQEDSFLRQIAEAETRNQFVLTYPDDYGVRLCPLNGIGVDEINHLITPEIKVLAQKDHSGGI